MLVRGNIEMWEPSGITDRVLGQLARRLRRHWHQVPIWEETIYEVSLVIGNTVEVLETRVFHPEANTSSRKNPASTWPSTLNLLTTNSRARIEKFVERKAFAKALHMDFKYKCGGMTVRIYYGLWLGLCK
jgi:hypothetical protein